MRLALITALCFTAFGAPGPAPLEEQFNLPGFNTMQENHEDKFLRVDRNKDKKLNFDEFLHMELAYVDAKKEEFDSLDKNLDGIITQKEYEEHYRGVTSRSEARRTAYFGRVFQEFDKNLDMSLSMDELENVLAKRFLVKPRQNFPKLFYNLDSDRSGGLDLTEYMKFDANFPFDQTDPISVARQEVPSGSKLSSKQGVPVKTPPVGNFNIAGEDMDAIAQVMAQASATFKMPKSVVVPQTNASSQHRAATPSNIDIHPVKPGPSLPTVPIKKIAKVLKSV